MYSARAGLMIVHPTKLNRIIINADDFGLSSESNRAILAAFIDGAISSTTLMTNMPGFEEACALVHPHGLSGKIGVHLNLTEGRPLTNSIRECVRLCDEGGNFCPRRRWLRLSSREAQAIREEVDAQISACVHRGITPTHIDSHHHVHTEWPIGTIVIDAALRFGIRSIRVSRNCGAGIGGFRRIYKWAYNARLKRYGLGRCRYFGSISDVQGILGKATGDVEIMVHLTAEDSLTKVDRMDGFGYRRWQSRYELASYL